VVPDVLEENERLTAENRTLRARTEYLERVLRQQEQRMDVLLRRLYGRRSERVENPAQLELPLELAEEAKREVEAEAARARAAELAAQNEPEPPPRKKPGRRPLPKGLPRKRVVLEPAAEDKVCGSCKGELKKIGEEVTETLDFVPASLFVTETVRPKYACPKCQEGVVTEPLPPRPIEKGRPGPGLLAQVTVSKFADHLPLYRQEAIFARQGLDLSRSTMCGWVREIADLVRPVTVEMKRRLFTLPLLQADETPVPTQVAGEGKWRIEKCYLWGYSEPWGEVVYDFTLSRSRDGPTRFLEKYRGHLQTDGYDGYNEAYRRWGLVRFGCWAHARRKFYDAQAERPEFAMLILSAIQKLYRIERQAKEGQLVGEKLRELRRAEALPLLEDLKGVLEISQERELPQSGLGLAISYALDQWDDLVRYADVPEAPIDNNSIEHAMRVVTLGRKNWLQIGSPDGGERTAILYSLTESCKRIGIDPFAYLRDIIGRLPSHPADRVGELTPRSWRDSLRREVAAATATAGE
jgi:transposase